MKRSAIAMLICMVAGAGCTPDAPPATPQPVPQALPDQRSAAPSQGNSAAISAVQSDMPVVPEGAQWTLYCMTINTLTHVPDSNALRAALLQKTHSAQWYVIHTENDSKLYYGYYKTFNNASQPAEKAKAQADLAMVSNLVDDSGNKPFATAGFMPISAPDPEAPPTWDVCNAPGHWALVVASYLGSPERKKAAVDSVREFRNHGIQAYYYHGPAISNVLIGTWPRSSVREQDSSSARASDPNATLLVPMVPLPKGAETNDLRMPDGSPVKLVQQKLDIADPTMIAAMKQYPANAVNGEEIIQRWKDSEGKIFDGPQPSYLVEIPNRDESSDASATPVNEPGDAPPNGTASAQIPGGNTPAMP